MAIINGVNMPNFKASEFSEDPNKYADPVLLANIQKYRTLLKDRFHPSPVPGALARFDEEDEDSQHYADIDQGIFSRALDGFPEGNIFKAWLSAQNCGLFNAVGVYFDTKRNGALWPMLHLDIRKSHPIIWFRVNGEYFYPHHEGFYKNLNRWFANWQAASETKIKQEIRVVLGLTQQEFCIKYKINPGTVSGWSTRKRVISPNHVTLLKGLNFSEDSLRDPGGFA